MKKEEILTIPNILSFVRVLLIPVIVYFYVVKQQHVTGVILLFFCELTDFLDGFLARKLNQITKLGKIIDPIADKLTQLAMCLCLVSRFENIRRLMWLFIVKEAIIAVIGLIIIRTDYAGQARWHGKINTVFFDCLLGIHMLWINIPAEFSSILTKISSLLMFISGMLYYYEEIGYIIRYYHRKKNEES